MKNRYKIISLSGLFMVLLSLTLCSQPDSTPHYYRLYLKDKGTPARVLLAGDPDYARAAALISQRALKRRAKVLPFDSLISTRDLPVYQPYLNAILGVPGVSVEQTSRWFNTVMIRCDSATYQTARKLPFLDSSLTMKAYRRRYDDPGAEKSARLLLSPVISSQSLQTSCLPPHYGLARTQNMLMGSESAHNMGLAGEGVFVGVLDAGFDWRHHATLAMTTVLGEYDFVNHDSTAYDLPGESAEDHGTLVSSVIGGYWKDNMIGLAPNVQFAFAKTEDVRSEFHIEEDNFVAGLEWLEAMGVDLTNTSLGYTTFDEPEAQHEYSELNGHTAFASKGANYATSLGMVCVVAAGNDGGRYNYVGVPAEADSAIAVAAVDSNGRIAGFSSRGFPGRSILKPNVAAMGVANYGANARDSLGFTRSQGTSFASPMVCGSVALLLTARPDLRPWEIREVLQRSAGRYNQPDTAYGYGLVSITSALNLLATTKPFAGIPLLGATASTIHIAAWIATGLGIPQPTADFTAEVVHVKSGASFSSTGSQPANGIARWAVAWSTAQMSVGDTFEVRIYPKGQPQNLLRRYRTIANTLDGQIATGSTLCGGFNFDFIPSIHAYPNPSNGLVYVTIRVTERKGVTLKVYNALGQIVGTLLDNAEREPGMYTLSFKRGTLPPGTYYFSMNFSGSSEVYTVPVICVR